MPTTLIITMAGFGRRFQDAGYRQPKYAIEVRGRSLFAWSMAGLAEFTRDGSPFIFVMRAADAARPFVTEQARACGISQLEIIELDAPTDGQATTALLAADRAPAARPLAIFNIDTGVDAGVLRPAVADDVDGWIPCFRQPGEGWSFVRTDAHLQALEVREKSRISEHASIGFYWFRTPALYRQAYASHFADPANLVRGERYVAPIYNALIATGHKVVISEIDAARVTPLGTPAEVEAFAAADRSRPPAP